MGAEGIMLPMVGSAEEARGILDSMKYHPQGRRGVALAVAHDRYIPGPTLDKLAAANRWTTLFTQIETRDGVANADAIAAVDGVDCLWVGHFDLSASLGIPGQFSHKDFTDAIGTVIKACRKHGKSAGRLVPTVDEGVAFHQTGFDFICYSGDVWALHGAVQQAVNEIRERAAPAKGRGKSKAMGKSGNKGKSGKKRK
jgi:2-keto-3-deoxy-L-rhamnonate aldolase RhmA